MFVWLRGTWAIPDMHLYAHHKNTSAMIEKFLFNLACGENDRILWVLWGKRNSRVFRGVDRRLQRGLFVPCYCYKRSWLWQNLESVSWISLILANVFQLEFWCVVNSYVVIKSPSTKLLYEVIILCPSAAAMLLQAPFCQQPLSFDYSQNH